MLSHKYIYSSSKYCIIEVHVRLISNLYYAFFYHNVLRVSLLDQLFIRRFLFLYSLCLTYPPLIRGPFFYVRSFYSYNGCWCENWNCFLIIPKTIKEKQCLQIRPTTFTVCALLCALKTKLNLNFEDLT